LCDCGSKGVVKKSNLTSGRSKSCGCLQSELLSNRNLIHGFSYHGSVRRVYVMWCGASKRAKKKKIPFTLTPNDIIIPEYCEVLGIKLEPGRNKVEDSSPSLDRIDINLGYVKGNVAVISHRANSIKSNGTAEEHRKIANYIDRHASS
jgi:hypothetical protein